MKRNEIQHSFGMRVKVLRKQSGLTQGQFAVLIGKSIDTVSNIERGSSTPRIRTALDIADALNSTLSKLFSLPPTDPVEAHHQQVMDRLSELTQGCDEKTLDAVVEAVGIIARVADKREDN